MTVLLLASLLLLPIEKELAQVAPIESVAPSISEPETTLEDGLFFADIVVIRATAASN